MLIEIHMLKNYPPTNLNRDDTGAPKTCEFGGVSRGRISSQCLKRSWRTSDILEQEVGSENLGIRTRTLPTLVAEKLLDQGIDPAYVEAVSGRISGLGNKDGKETKEGKITAQIVFYAKEDIEAVTQSVKTLLGSCSSLKDVKALKVKDLQAAISDAKVRPITLDIALFGRMVTSDAFRDVEASMQVAHAISTNRVSLESDYFTAMDDLLSGDTMEEAGAGMIGDTDYNSSCYYVYANIDTDSLMENLKYSENPEKIVQKAVPALLRAMIFTNPGGKQNSFAGHVLPSAILLECKNKKIPTSMVNAFVEPIRQTHEGDLVKNSITALRDEADMIARNYGLEVSERLWFCTDKYNVKPDSEHHSCSTVQALIEALSAAMN